MESFFVFISLICCMTLISAELALRTTTVRGVCGRSRGDIYPGTRVNDPRLYTASHRTLPLNTRVFVDTGVVGITVRITGHQTESEHMLDLSPRAAKALHMRGRATARCALTVVQKPKNGFIRDYHLRSTIVNENVYGCKSSWDGICRTAADCCSHHCVHVDRTGGPGVCFPRNFMPSRLAPELVQ